ncbi:hypothetical protein [Phenylobacterium sp.]|uniref:hypothetical protein n=1 Tax=Phenylobacterium sp. TaxID=1871053 RepID=UPI00289E670B|nr:hypothetical protein [Phenylobacterium sp.]
MTSTTPAASDNRRAVVRIMAYEIMRISSSMAKVHGGDIIEYLVFTAIWVLNTNHLIGDPRYSELKSIPPDPLRKPATMDDLRRTVPMPDDILRTYVDRLLARGYVEERPGGFVAPTAVFAQPEMLNGSNELYSHVMTMVRSMRTAGFAFGD